MLRNVRYNSHYSVQHAEYALEYGDPREDLAVATVLMIVGGKLVLLKPRKV